MSREGKRGGRVKTDSTQEQIPYNEDDHHYT